MKSLPKDLIVYSSLLVGAYLILVHYTGFSRSVSSLGQAYVGGVKALQGR